MHGMASLAVLALAPSPPRAAAAGAVAVHVDDGGGLVDVAAAAIAIGHGGGGGGRFVIAVGWGGFTTHTITSLPPHNATSLTHTQFTSDSGGGEMANW